MAPLHKNYGDEAILLATKQFLEDYFPDIKQIVIQVKQFLNNLDLIHYFISYVYLKYLSFGFFPFSKYSI
jgi:exopolysaccharide biosynthesis predicted pyruvyltransferase EpsI